MSLSRRQFFKLAASGVVGAAVTANIDIEKLLWVPGQKSYHFMPGGEHFVTMDWLTREVARSLKRNLKLLRAVNRSYDDQYMKIGSTVHVRVPQRFELSGRTFMPQQIADTTWPVVLTDQLSVFTLSAPNMTMPQARVHAEIVGESLAREANKRGLDTFGRMRLPVGVQQAVSVGDHEVSVRGVRDCDIYTDTDITRFDIIGGSSGQKGKRL